MVRQLRIGESAFTVTLENISHGLIYDRPAATIRLNQFMTSFEKLDCLTDFAFDRVFESADLGGGITVAEARAITREIMISLHASIMDNPPAWVPILGRGVVENSA